MAPAKNTASKPTTETAPPKDDAPKAEKPKAEPTRYRVLRAITLGSGQTLRSGAVLEIAEGDPEWPARRPGQLVKQGFLRQMEG